MYNPPSPQTDEQAPPSGRGQSVTPAVRTDCRQPGGFPSPVPPFARGGSTSRESPRTPFRKGGDAERCSRIGVTKNVTHVFRWCPSKVTSALLIGISVSLIAAERPDPTGEQLLLWLDASDASSLTLDAEGNIASWENRASRAPCTMRSAGRQRPRFVKEALGGRPALRFDGRDDLLRETAFNQTLQTWTLFVAAAPRSNQGSFRALITGNKRGVNDYVSGINLDLGGAPSNQYDCLNLEGGKHRGQCNLRTDSSVFGGTVVCVSAGNALARAFINGAEEGSRSASSAPSILEELRIGARYYENPPGARPLKERDFFHGDIAEVLLYAGELPPAKRTVIEAYLVDKYGSGLVMTPRPTLAEAFEYLPTYEFGQSRRPLEAIDQAVQQRFGDPAGRAKFQLRLLTVLSGTATRAAKDYVCRRLARIGTEESVVPLTALLTDPANASMARYALERIPSPSATKALCTALAKLSGAAKVGVINSLGRRGDRSAVAYLVPLLTDADGDVAAAAAVALGRTGDPRAVAALRDAGKGATGAFQAAIFEALLTLGYRLLEQDRREEAAAIFRGFARAGDEHVRVAALRGLLFAEPAHAVRLLLLAAEAERARLHAVVSRWIRTQDRTPVLLALVANGDDHDRAVLLPLLGRVGGAEARAAVLRYAAAQTEIVREAAFRALALWPDGSVAEDLLGLAERSVEQGAESRKAALRALPVLLGLPGSPPPQRAVALLGRAAELTEDSVVLRGILERLAGLRVAEALTLAQDFLDDDAVKENAATAVLALAEALRSVHPKQARDALTRLYAEARDTRQRARIQELLAAIDAGGDTLLAVPPELASQIPPPRTRTEVDAVRKDAARDAPRRPIHIVLVAGKKDHGPGEHDYPAWQDAWARLLARAPRTRVTTAWERPRLEDFATADVLVVFRHGAWPAAVNEAVDTYFDRGGGMVLLHYAVDALGNRASVGNHIGLYWGEGARFRHGWLDLCFSATASHPILRGFAGKTIRFHDESYWRLTGDPARIEVLATAVEKEGNDAVTIPLLWNKQSGNGRVHVNILGHYSWTFNDPLFRIVLLRAIAWTAKEPVDRFDSLATVGVRLAE